MTETGRNGASVTVNPNKFGGRCFDYGRYVSPGAGRLGVHFLGGGRHKFVVFSKEAARARGQAGEREFNSADLSRMSTTNFMASAGLPRRTVKGGTRGRTLNLSSTETWKHVFDENTAVARTSGGNPLTDAQISTFMKSEFPNITGKATAIETVATRRHQYNDVKAPFSRFGKPSMESHQYDIDGGIVRSGSSRTSRTVIAPVDQEMLRDMVQGEVSKAVAFAVNKAIKAPAPQLIIEWRARKKVKIDAAGKHKKFAAVLQRISAGLPVLLVGPTGSGKTFLAGQVAEALSLPFTFNSMSEGISESVLLGRTLPDAKGNWKYQPSPFVTSFQNGGVHLLDEIDGSDPNLLVQINASLANGLLSIPFAGTEPIKQHEDSIVIAAANTFGHGADREYVGRNQLDAATLNRFTMSTIEIGYDEDVERAIVKAVLGRKHSKHSPFLLSWAHGVRERINTQRLRRVMSTRNIEDGAKLLASGVDPNEVKRAYFTGWSEDEQEKVRG